MKPFEQNVSSQYGAPMGRRSDNPANFDGAKIKLYRVKLYDYCYDKGGAYWGMGDPLYCATTETDTECLQYFFRAKNYTEAKTHMKELGARGI